MYIGLDGGTPTCTEMGGGVGGPPEILGSPSGSLRSLWPH